MNVEVSTIMGLALGIEYIQANDEAGIDFPCFVIDLLVVRFIVELTGE